MVSIRQWWEHLQQDARYGARQIKNNSGFSTVVILSLALGIGASTSVFSVADALLLRPLSYPGPQQLVRIWEQAPDGHRMNVADPNFDDFRTQGGTFSSMVAYESWIRSVSGGREPSRVAVTRVSNGFFDTMRVQPVRGRVFLPEEERLHGAPAAIVSYSYWKQNFNAAGDLSSLQIKVERSAYPVVGVMPDGFDFPEGSSVWIFRDVEPNLSRSSHNLRVIGRVRDGLTVAQARANLSAIARRIRATYGKDVNLNDAAVVPLADAIIGDVRMAMLTLLGAVGLLLVVSSTNVAGLLVTRASSRTRELAVRTAIGASRIRLMQQFLTESCLLASLGGVAGVLLAYWAVRALPVILPEDLPRQEGIAINAPVLLFALGITIAVALSLGLFTALRASRADPQEALNAGSRAHSGDSAVQRLRRVLVSGEVAMTFVLLVGAGLLGASFLKLASENPGFRPENLVTIQFTPADSFSDFVVNQAAIGKQAQLLDELVARLRTIPDVDDAGVAGALPVADGDNLADGDFLILNGRKPPTTDQEWKRMVREPANVGHATYCVASGEYFRTLGIPPVRGRTFDDRDQSKSPHVALISQTLASQRWPGQDPIGQLIYYGNMDGNPNPLTIVGVVGDIRGRGLDLPASPIIYVDHRQRGLLNASSPTIVVRSGAPLARLVPIARKIFQDLAPDVPVKFSRFEDELGSWFAERRFLLLLVTLFSATALTLGAIGIYGVVAFSVVRRTQEIGIRVAMGARRSHILRLVVGEGARIAIVGIVIGVGVSLAVTRLISSLLFGISGTDPVTFAGVGVLLVGVALVASYIPARRAMRTDPIGALRCN